MAGKVSTQVVVKSAANDFWNGLMDYVDLFPKAAPGFYKSIQVLQGDGVSLGSVRLVTFGEELPVGTTAKEKVVALDSVSKKISYEVIDGDEMKYYKTYEVHIEVVPKEDGEGSLVYWSCEFEKLSPQVPDPTLDRDSAVRIFTQVDAYLLKA